MTPPRSIFPLASLALGAVLALGACASTPPAARSPDRGPASAHEGPHASTPTLYEEIGGEAGVASLSERLIREIATDERIRGHYRNTDMGRFHRMMQSQMCAATGGGCTYTGDDMRRTHGGMHITPTEFNAVVEALMRAMDAEGLPVATQNRLLAIYAPMREDIIDR